MGVRHAHRPVGRDQAQLLHVPADERAQRRLGLGLARPRDVAKVRLQAAELILNVDQIASFLGANRLAANRFAVKTLFAPSVLEYPLFTWQFGVVQSNGSSANWFAAMVLMCRSF